ncbi:MAG TPA: hypothetical protein VH596_15965 [Terriglobales bacterium]|jgi:hypothetical protein
MLSKCANPDCAVTFRYFHTGKLYRVETSTGFERRRAMGLDGEPGKPLRRLEFYWLCQHCAEKMTLVYEKESGVTVRPDDLAHSAVA